MNRTYRIVGIIFITALVFITTLWFLTARAQPGVQQVAPAKSRQPPEYLLIKEGESTLAGKVTEKMREGFTPQGGVSATRLEDGHELFYQAMVR